MGGKPKLISMREAMTKGIPHLRKPVWVDPHDHVEIQIIEYQGTKSFGPWVSLWSPGNEAVGNNNPHKMLSVQFDWDCQEWLPWKDPDANPPQVL
jgi:hypothetical protein